MLFLVPEEPFEVFEPPDPGGLLPRLRDRALVILERLLSKKLLPVREFGMPTVFSSGRGLPWTLRSTVTTRTRHGGMEPRMMPTENSAKVQSPRVTISPG